VAMDPTAAAAPITKADAPLLVLQPIARIDSKTVPALGSLSVITATAAAPVRESRVSVGHADCSRIVELTRDGLLVRTFEMGCADHIGTNTLGVGDGWLVACSERRGVSAVALADRPDRSWPALQPLNPLPAELSDEVFGALPVEDMIVLWHVYDDWIRIVPLAPPFV
jgi:hypothetical protein